MPGPITLVLNRNSNLSEYVTNGKDTIAVRMETSNVLEELIKKTWSPLFMTSSNRSEEPECTNLDDIEKTCPLLDGMLDRDVVCGEASTIVDCSLEELRILRIGPISKEQIKKVINMKWR